MIIPRFVSAKDTVAVVATAKKVNREDAIKGIEVLSSWGLKVKVGKFVFHTSNQFAGTDAQRAEDLQSMIDDQEIKVIFMLRGGYGTTRIIDHINFSSLHKYPKWICGFSDITAIHLHLYNLGIASIHSPMPSFFHAVDQNSLQSLHDLIFGNKILYKRGVHEFNIHGKSTGMMIGGNLSIICNTLGTNSEIQKGNHILFLEDIGEQLYHLDRMMVQLKRAGFLRHLAGLIVGQFSDMKDSEDSFGLNAYEIINSHTREYGYPIVYNFPIGHTNENHAVPVGIIADLIVDAEGCRLKLHE